MITPDTPTSGREATADAPHESIASVRRLLSPRSIAILGASADFGKINGKTLKALLDQGYAGAIYPVNPKYSEIAGLKCYASLSAIQGDVDLAIIATPADRVADTLLELGRRKVRAAVVFSSGFAEVGEKGAARQRDLHEAIRASGVRVLGPNCLGFINAFEHVMGTFSYLAASPNLPGPVAFITQSGAFGSATASLARKRGIHLGYFANTGNEADIGFVDLMAEALLDPRIAVGAGYIEGLKDGPGFVRLAAWALDAGKPLVITKVGRTPAGARAVASHTGSLAGADAVFDGVLRQFGVVRARNDEQLLDFVDVLSRCALPNGRRLAILTRSGGAGALMADRAEDLGLELASFSAATAADLQRIVPEFGAIGNPVDVTAQGLYSPNLLGDCLDVMLADAGVDVAVVWLAFSESIADHMVRLFIGAKSRSSKPFVVSWTGAPDAAMKSLQDAGIPVLRGPEPAIEAIAALVRYAESRRAWLGNRPFCAQDRGVSVTLPEQGGVVATTAAATILRQCGIALAPLEFAADANAAADAAARLGFPVAIKIESPDIQHKTEARGVQLGLADAAAVRAAFDEVTANARRFSPTARIDGVVVQAMRGGDVELVVGLKNDPVFGIVIMVGLGGIFVEVLKDVAFRKAPVTEPEAEDMLRELKGSAMLDGARGRRPVHRPAAARFISAVSRFGAAAGKRIEELDLNPVMAGVDGVIAVDVLLVLK